MMFFSSFQTFVALPRILGEEGRYKVHGVRKDTVEVDQNPGSLFRSIDVHGRHCEVLL